MAPIELTKQAMLQEDGITVMGTCFSSVIKLKNGSHLKLATTGSMVE